MDKMTSVPVEPDFELEEFMNFSKETQLDGDTLEKLGALWENWINLLGAKQIHGGKKSWLAVWLPESVEETVDTAWAQSPSQGYLMNCLAQYICMSAVQQKLPQTAASGCAPAPLPDSTLRDSLAELGLVNGEGSLVRRYAVVTYFPFKGGCEVCAMSGTCPKAGGSENFASVLLPGYERQA